MLSSGFSLHLNLPDLWQQEAVRHIRAGRDVIVDAPTGAGKTRIFELLVEGGHVKGQAVYTVPTRALANDKLLEWRRRGWKVGIVTGEISENTDAPVVVATLETQRERLLRGDGPALLVVDEYQMIADPARGTAYEMALALAPKQETRLLLLSGSVANAKDVAEWLTRLGRAVETVTTRERPVPLEEMPVEQLSRRAPKQLTGYWPRLAAEVLLSGLGPLLIFAPHRKDAEKIARQIAGALPSPDKLPLTRAQEHALGSVASELLRARVACHHSGLSYQARAGVIEPLAKAGQLRVVVATTGLAAGINFSMRSVVVADTRYFDGRAERELAPDELLQMFGRAGRRGLDDTGYVIVSGRGPRLGDASPRRLRRANQVDWPTLLRVMDRAAARGEPPFEAAALFCQDLFSRQRIVLGFESRAAGTSAAPANSPEKGAGDGQNLFGLGPTRALMRNSLGQWEDLRRDRSGEAPLSDARLPGEGPAVPVLESADFVGRSFPIGRLCRLPGKNRFGRELALAVGKDADVFFITRNIKSLLSRSLDRNYSAAELETDLVPLLSSSLAGGAPAGLIARGGQISLLVDYSGVLWPVRFDSLGVPLIEPEERVESLAVGHDITDTAGVSREAAGHTAVHAWRMLGLIEPDGKPTRRGLVFSRFQGGEGLAIAAALEDESYPVTDLARHIANLRGGHRFSDGQSRGESERLAAVCLQAYGAANHEGYLEAGLPIGYGEGTAEILVPPAAAATTSATVESRPRPSARVELSPHLGEGDLERARSEWLSLLRAVTHANGMDWPRWSAFQTACREELARRLPDLPSRELPPVPSSQLVHQTAHHAMGF